MPIDLATAMSKMLDDNCSNPTTQVGYNVYTFYLCCLSWAITAKKTADGWEILEMQSSEN